MGGGVSGLGNPGRGRGLEVQEIQEQGGGGQKLLPSVGGVWIFSGITHLPIQGCRSKKKISMIIFNKSYNSPLY